MIELIDGLTDEQMLQVVSVDLLTGENGRSHRTFDYELMERPSGADLVVRRGQPFHLAITFNRRFQQEDDALCLVFTVAGIHPSPPPPPLPIQLIDSSCVTQTLQGPAPATER